MRTLAAVLLILCTAGCEKRPSAPPTPSPGDPGETITGRERIGWDQLAANLDELATFRYAIFVDGNRSEVSAVSCASTASTSGFPCSGALPGISGGAHALQMSAFIIRNGQTFESERSPALNVVVTGSGSSERAATPAAGAMIQAPGGAALRVGHVADGLDEPTDLAIAADGRVFIADARGRISIVRAEQRRTALEPEPGGREPVVALALDPQFERSGLVYVVRAMLDNAPPVFRLVRYREVGGVLGEAATLLDNVPASPWQPAAALRFGPDGRLYAAFEERSSAPPTDASFNGKILRLNPDGTTPRDQPGGRPVWAAGVRRPRGIAWDAAGMLWIVDGDAARVERLTGVGAGPAPMPAPAAYSLPAPFGASGAVFETAGDLLIAGETAGYLLRVRFDPDNRQRVVGSDRLLKGEVDSIRAVAIAPDGSILICTRTALIDLSRR